MGRYTATPEIHKMNGEEYYFDPVRKRLMLATPEETVRQKVLVCLMDELHVPKKMIRVDDPSIVARNGFDLGTLLNDRLWYLDDGRGTELAVNLIACALLRDEYRKQVS